MGKGIVIHLDNDGDLLRMSENYFKQSPLAADFELVTCNTHENCEEAIQKHREMIRCLIFDLVGFKPGKTELDEGNARFLADVDSAFASFNIPIFIYSGYLELVTEQLKNSGIVFKVDKERGIDVIFDKLKTLHDSGFIDVFRPGGVLDTEIRSDMHSSFVGQFRNGEIETIIQSIKNSSPDDFRARCIDVFKRITVKACMSKLLSPVVEATSTVNAIEHYYRRISGVEFWTGDILQKDDTSELLIILTPRCDCSEALNFLVCSIEEGFPTVTSSNTKKEQIRAALTNNPSMSRNQYRFLPPTPLFGGGKVSIATHRTMSREELRANYRVIATLSDDLANEILAMVGAHFLRTGINTINLDELVSYLDSLHEDSNG